MKAKILQRDSKDLTDAYTTYRTQVNVYSNIRNN